MTQPTVAIIGGGQAGFQVAAALRDHSYAGRVVLVGDEPHPPYRRPPLSKGYLLGEAAEDQVGLCPPSWAAQRGVELMTGKRAVSIDRTQRRLQLDDGSLLAYEHLVLATGARHRRLPVAGTELQNVFFLRTRDEADAVRAALGSARRAVVIGAGFIGLEFAACAVKLGLDVSVLDLAERPMARALSRTMSGIFAREHAQLGVRLLCNTRVRRLVGEGGRVTGVETHTGEVLPADLVVIGIGVIPNDELAAGCDLPVDDGVVVNALLQTRDPFISAVGDVAAHVSRYADGQRIRLESVQNACDQARCVAARIVGKPSAYDALPWFWTHQGALKLQMAGVPGADYEEVVRGDERGTACSVFLFRAGRLSCVESLNRPAEHLLARRLLAARAPVTPSQAADPAFDLKTLLA